jgi:uncharacterized protein YbbC (DUF1343 family)
MRRESGDPLHDLFFKTQHNANREQHYGHAGGDADNAYFYNRAGDVTFVFTVTGDPPCYEPFNIQKMRLVHKNNKLLQCLIFILPVCVMMRAQTVPVKEYSTVVTGAEDLDACLPLLKNKRVGIITNITGMVGGTSIVDTLISLGVKVKVIFGPEHGFRSEAEAGEKVKSNKDPKTGLPVVSLYGATKKPGREQLKDLDVLVYDIQDIGVRFYTYISTMCYAMEACAENNKEFIVLDRPNPNGYYIDGPVMQDAYKGFLGLHNVPLVYGMTCGEYAAMANGEGWLKNSVKCRLRVIPLKNYDRKSSYSLPVKPSPNIPNELAVALYPSLGVFEGTIMSLGRGTDFPFQVLGHPAFSDTAFSFTPRPTKISASPKYVNTRCYGIDLRQCSESGRNPRQISLQWLYTCYEKTGGEGFFEKYFNHHAGNSELQEQLKKGIPEAVIRESWKEDIEKFKIIRKKYLLYADFE